MPLRPAALLQLFDEPLRQEFPCMTRWFRTLQHHPHFAAVWGELTLCETALKFSAPLLVVSHAQLVGLLCKSTSCLPRAWSR